MKPMLLFFQCTYISFRWRKPRWIPQAKSKVFRIPKREEPNFEEAVELRRLHNIYRTQIRAIRRHFKEEFIRTSDTSAVAMMKAQEEEEEHQRLMEFNTLENERIAVERERR